MASSLLGRIATSYYFMENYHAALDTNLKRLKLKEELNDREWIASTLDDLTSNYLSLGNYPAALDTARRAIAIYEELNDDGGVARVLILLGNIHTRAERLRTGHCQLPKSRLDFCQEWRCHRPRPGYAQHRRSLQCRWEITAARSTLIRKLWLSSPKEKSCREWRWPCLKSARSIPR